jgi:hypothetical protein
MSSLDNASILDNIGKSNFEELPEEAFKNPNEREGRVSKQTGNLIKFKVILLYFLKIFFL